MSNGKVYAYDQMGNLLDSRNYSSKEGLKTIISFFWYDYKKTLGWIQIFPETNSELIDGNGKNIICTKPPTHYFRKDEPMRFPKDHGIRNTKKARNLAKYQRTYILPK